MVARRYTPPARFARVHPRRCGQQRGRCAAALSGGLSGPYRPAFTNGSGRLDLAWAIVSKTEPDYPARMVNRIWLHHFGEGFVSTPDDLGTRSEAAQPSQLLDYLAARDWWTRAGASKKCIG